MYISDDMACLLVAVQGGCYSEVKYIGSLDGGYETGCYAQVLAIHSWLLIQVRLHMLSWYDLKHSENETFVINVDLAQIIFFNI